MALQLLLGGGYICRDSEAVCQHYNESPQQESPEALKRHNAAKEKNLSVLILSP